jgi:hypothetical protein
MLLLKDTRSIGKLSVTFFREFYILQVKNSQGLYLSVSCSIRMNNHWFILSSDCPWQCWFLHRKCYLIKIYIIILVLNLTKYIFTAKNSIDAFEAAINPPWMCLTAYILWEPLTVKRALPNLHSPWQLQRPLGLAPPSDKHIKMRSSGTAATVTVTLTSRQQHNSESTPPAIVSTGPAQLPGRQHREDRPACCQPAAKASLLWPEFRQNLSDTLPYKYGPFQEPQSLTGYCTLCLRNTALSHRLPHTLPACPSVYSVNRNRHLL